MLPLRAWQALARGSLAEAGEPALSPGSCAASSGAVAASAPGGMVEARTAQRPPRSSCPKRLQRDGCCCQALDSRNMQSESDKLWSMRSS